MTWPIDAKPNAYGRALRLRWKLERALCAVLGHKLPPAPIPGSRVSGFGGVWLCACDRCHEGVAVRPLDPFPPAGRYGDDGCGWERAA